MDLKKKKKIPYIFRNKFSCPDCGFIYSSETLIAEKRKNNLMFICIKCSTRLTWEEFDDENRDKWSKEADLSFELQESESNYE